MTKMFDELVSKENTTEELTFGEVCYWMGNLLQDQEHYSSITCARENYLNEEEHLREYGKRHVMHWIKSAVKNHHPKILSLQAELVENKETIIGREIEDVSNAVKKEQKEGIKYMLLAGIDLQKSGDKYETERFMRLSGLNSVQSSKAIDILEKKAHRDEIAPLNYDNGRLTGEKFPGKDFIIGHSRITSANLYRHYFNF